MRAETSATSAVATLSVAVAVVGHVLAGGAASLAAVPQLVVLAAIGWILGERMAGRRWFSLVVLGALQLTTHLALDAGRAVGMAPAPAGAGGQTSLEQAAMAHSAGHDMAAAHGMDHASVGHVAAHGDVVATGEPAAAMHGSIADTLTMSAAHLLVLLAGVALVGSTHRWVQRVLRILARLVPHLPAAAVAMPGVRAALPGVPEQPRLTQRWLTSGVSRRGPPRYGVLPAPS